MFTKQRLLAFAVTAALVTALAACGGSGADDRVPADSVGHSDSADVGAGQDTGPRTDTVHGLRDGVRHVSERTAGATRPHMVMKCASATRRVRHTSSTGTGSRRTTRTWYTTQHYRSCRKVRSGSETYRRVVRPERWCVRLDDVDGVTREDDVWYRVTRHTYDEAVSAREHARMEFTPAGTGC